MSVSAHIHRRLVDLLEESRVVVWYDGEEHYARAGHAVHGSALSARGHVRVNAQVAA